MTSDKSPCLKCDIHLEGRDKNKAGCPCKAATDYVNDIEDPYVLTQQAGFESEAAAPAIGEVIEITPVSDAPARPALVPVQKQTKKEKIVMSESKESIFAQICRKYGISKSTFFDKSRRMGGYSQARKDLVLRLAGRVDGVSVTPKMSRMEIAVFVGVSIQRVDQIISESREKLKPEKKPEPVTLPEQPDPAPPVKKNNTKNKLHHLNDHLFLAIERLNDEDIKGEDLAKEIGRAKAISNVATQIINNARLAVQAMQAINEGLIKRPPEMLGINGYRDHNET